LNGQIVRDSYEYVNPNVYNLSSPQTVLGVAAKQSPEGQFAQNMPKMTNAEHKENNGSGSAGQVSGPGAPGATQHAFN